MHFFNTASSSRMALFIFFELSILSILVSIIPRSASSSSAFIVSISLRGFMSPSTWATFSFLKARTIWTRASTLRTDSRNWLPMPIPALEPLTSPGRSIISMVA